NAERDFGITRHEGDIIQSHMFPLEGFPASREACLLALADKGISLAEALAGLRARMGVRRG
ncbi:MAG: phosphohydrolase, partial [Atopobiaceae bacterium]|nr:phosphohydrolase [Atopobiaceae bacterium]